MITVAIILGLFIVLVAAFTITWRQYTLRAYRKAAYAHVIKAAANRPVGDGWPALAERLWPDSDSNRWPDQCAYPPCDHEDHWTCGNHRCKIPAPFSGLPCIRPPGHTGLHRNRRGWGWDSADAEQEIPPPQGRHHRKQYQTGSDVVHASITDLPDPWDSRWTR